MHIREKTKECNQCNFASTWASALRDHQNLHRGEKSNKCNQCDFASSWAGSLRSHLKTHSGEKSNKCNQCDYTCSSASNLRTHFKVHCGDKLNKCRQCDQEGHHQKKVTKLRTFSVPLLAPPSPHLRTLMGVFFLKARTDDSRHLAKKARMLQFLGEPILFIRNS